MHPCQPALTAKPKDLWYPYNPLQKSVWKAEKGNESRGYWHLEECGDEVHLLWAWWHQRVCERCSEHQEVEFGIWCLDGEFRDVPLNPTLQALVKEYKDSGCKEKSKETRRRLSDLKAKISIGNTLNDSRITITGEKTPEAAKSIGRLTSGADERRRLLSIVIRDYPYRFLQQLFGCSSKTMTAAKVHHILFGRGGTPPSKFKFTRQCVSPEVLMKGQCEGTCKPVSPEISKWCQAHIHLYTSPS